MNPDDIAEELAKKINLAEIQYYRLVLLVGPPSSGKTSILRQLQERASYPLINLSLELSHRMLDLDLTHKLRNLQTPELVREIIVRTGSKAVLLDNIEILFDTNLKWHVLGLLQNLSKNTTIVATWPGTAEHGRLSYAEPDHPEHERHEIRDFLLVNVADSK